MGNSETDFRVRYHSEDSRRERMELLGAQPVLHLHSRMLRLRTFAGKDISITAPLPEPMVETLKRLGWSDYLRKADREAHERRVWVPAKDEHVMAALEEVEAAAESIKAGFKEKIQVGPDRYKTRRNAKTKQRPEASDE